MKTLEWLAVWGMGWYMDSPYRTAKINAIAGTGARDVRMNN